MSIDDAEKKLKELMDGPKPPESAAKDAVIGGTGNQARWEKAQEVHNLGDESATGLFRDPATSTCKFGIDGLEDGALKIAYDFKDAQRDISAGVKKVGTFADCSKQSLTSLEKPSSIDPFHPHAGNEDAYVSYPACIAANTGFPELKSRLGAGPGHIDKALIAATIRLEVAFYKQGFDSGQDKYIQEHGRDDGIGPNTSIGPAQMQIRHINRLVHQFPWQLGHFSADPLRAALKPENAPHFVGGYYSDVIQHINKGTKPDYIGGKDWDGVKKYWNEGDYNAALIYAYNPTNDHVDSVKKQVKLIQEKF